MALACETKPLEYSEATVVPADTSAACAIEKTRHGQPILVVKCVAQQDRLEGIVTAFDLL